MSATEYDAGTTIGLQIATLVRDVHAVRAKASRIRDTLNAIAYDGGQVAVWSRLESDPSIKAADEDGQNVYDKINGIATALNSNDCVYGLNDLDKGFS